MNKTIIAIAMVGSLAVSLSAFANKGADYVSTKSSSDWSKNWYVGGGINGNSVNTNEHDIRFFDLKTDLDETKVGFDIFVGKNINKHWALEMGFTQVGDTTFDVDAGDFGIDAIEFEVSQWNVHMVGMYKLPVADHFNVFGKFGAAYMNSTQNFNVNIEVDDGEFEEFEATEGTLGTFAITYGFGAEVSWDRWGVRGEYNVIRPAQDIQLQYYVADIISLNGYYKFSY
jgi:opacity protein-like surface antigen